MFEKIKINILTEYLQLDGNWIFDFSNSNYIQLKSEQDNIESLILLNWDKIENLNFADTRNRAFVFLLLDLCERLQLFTCIQVISNLLDNNNIIIGYRLKASLLFNTGIINVEQYIERFDDICILLEKSLVDEEDNNQKVLATFANYYITVLGVHEIWIQKFKSLIKQSVEKYPFLSSEFISTLLSFDTSNYEICLNNIRSLKDKLFGRKELVDIFNNNHFLIEDGDYANRIVNIANISFIDLRQIAVNSINKGLKLNNRGVLPLTTEEELFAYFYNYGNMHYSKMLSALEMMPIDEINDNIDIIDWGCGQALATLAFLDYFKIKERNINPNFALIEPSEIAIKRATLHVKTFTENSNIYTLCKYLDDISDNDIISQCNRTKIHLFSNILDIEMFSLSQLENFISKTQKGLNYFICVSPYINDLKTDRIDSFRKYFKENYDTFMPIGEATTTKNSFDAYWFCNNNYNGYFNGNYCKQKHPVCGCNEQWTRVIRVFKVVI